jgi:hypothetical protein
VEIDKPTIKRKIELSQLYTMYIITINVVLNEHPETYRTLVKWFIFDTFIHPSSSPEAIVASVKLTSRFIASLKELFVFHPI